MKNLVRRLLASLGYDLHHRTSDPVLAILDSVRDLVRLNPGQHACALHALSQLSLAAHVRALLEVHLPDLVVDIGANRGQFALQLRSLGYAGPIVSLEPQRAHAKSLQARAATHDPAWTVHHAAAGDQPGVLALQTFTDDVFSSFHTPTDAARARFGDLLRPTTVEEVEVFRVDDLLANSPHAKATRIFLKTDTQGHDLAVLRGASATLERSLVVLAEGSLVPLYDTVATPAALDALLAPIGFRPAGAYAVSHDNVNLAAIELDCLFTRAARSA